MRLACIMVGAIAWRMPWLKISIRDAGSRRYQQLWCDLPSNESLCERRPFARRGHRTTPSTHLRMDQRYHRVAAIAWRMPWLKISIRDAGSCRYQQLWCDLLCSSSGNRLNASTRAARWRRSLLAIGFPDGNWSHPILCHREPS